MATMSESKSPASSEHRVVLVSGVGSEIGHATVMEFARAEYKVAICGRSETVASLWLDLNEIDCDDKGSRFYAECLEPTTNVEQAVEKVLTKFGRLDAVVNICDGSGARLDLWDENFLRDFESVIDSNLFGVTRICQLTAPHLVKSSRGLILNVCPVVDNLADSSLALCVSNEGISMLTKVLANELEGTNVRVLSLVVKSAGRNAESGTQNYNAPSSGSTGAARTMARVIKFFESERASFVHGTTIEMDVN